MRRLLPLVSYLALAVIVMAPILYFTGDLTHDAVKTVMLLATVLWFAVTPFWMNDRRRA